MNASLPILATLLAATSASALAATTADSPVSATAEPMLVAQADTPRSRDGAASRRPALRAGIDDVLAEYGALPDAPEAGHQVALRASPWVLWQPNRTWELRAGASLAYTEQGGGSFSFSRTRADWDETYVRWRQGETRLTFGTQTILWGRADEIPLADRVSRVDATRFLLDDLPERRLALPALRWEQTFDAVKLDVVALPAWRGAALPDARDVWSPVNTARGEVLGIETTPLEAAFVRAAGLRHAGTASGGAALRITRGGEGGVDLGATLARTRQSVPYLQTDPATLTLQAVHPYVRFAGVDAETVAGGVTWRTELSVSDGVPFTALDGRLTDRRVVEWIGAAEFFPGGEDTRVNLQLATRRVSGDAAVRQRVRYTALNGEIESALAQGRIKAGIRFNLGLDVRDVYVSPRLAWVGWEPHELYVAWHHFEGEARTFGHFHRDHGMLAVGLKTRF